MEGQIKAHTGAIYTISTTNEGILTGGKDGYARLWSTNLQVNAGAFSRTAITLYVDHVWHILYLLLLLPPPPPPRTIMTG